MDNAEELPSWAARKHAPGSNLEVAEAPPPKRRRFPRVLLGLLGLLTLLAMAGLGYLVATLTSDDTAVATEDTDTSIGSETDETEDAAGAEAEEATSDDGDTETATDDGDGDGATDESTEDSAATDDTDTDDAEDTADDTATDETAEDGDDAEDGSTGEPVDNSDGSIRYAVLQGGQLYLRGRVPDEELGNRIEEVALGVMGPGNVFNEYEIDPTTPETIGGPVYVEDVVLFAFNSVEIESAFLPILDLGTALMTQNPTVEMTVVSRTDAVGSEAVNMDVSRQRAEAVVDYWASKGIDPSRLTVDPRGEEDASEDDTDEQAARNRRVEFVINNLFG